MLVVIVATCPSCAWAGRRMLMIFKKVALWGWWSFFCLPIFAPVDTAWVRLYNGPGNGYDEAVALALDDSGNVYVAGYSLGSGTSSDYTTIKYSPDGDTLWVKRYNRTGNSPDYGRALAVDKNRNVYVTGQSWTSVTNYDYTTIKYAPHGDTLWVRHYNGPGNDFDRAYALAVDDSGNVYVTGVSWGGGTSYDFATIKYSPDGATSWVRRYNGPGNFYDDARSLSLNEAGGVYVAGGSTGSGTDFDYCVVKYAANGDTQWVRRYNGPENAGDFAYSLVRDGSGNIYVTGNSYGGVSFSDIATIKYNTNGETLWVRRYNTPANPGNFDDIAKALTVDASGNVYVTGYSGFLPDFDYLTIKYTPNGDTAWIRRYNATENSTDVARALAIDNNGDVYVTGYGGIFPNYNYITIKYASNGDTLWVRDFNGAGNEIDSANALAVDQNASVYVTGISRGSGTNYDFATIKYAQFSGCIAKPGDANVSGSYTLADVIAIVNYVFNKPGCTPQPLCWLSNLLCRGDWNGSNSVTLSDVIQGVNFIFNKPGGPWDAVPVGVCCLPAP